MHRFLVDTAVLECDAPDVPKDVRAETTAIFAVGAIAAALQP